MKAIPNPSVDSRINLVLNSNRFLDNTIGDKADNDAI